VEHSYWIIFISTAIVLNITPGHDMIYLITQSMSYGKRVGFASVLGLGTGALIHTTLVAFGISAIISASITAFMVMKFAGAAYLFYLGIKALMYSNIDFSNIDKRIERKTFMKSYINAVLIDVTNPKVTIFFMAFLPQFYRDNGSSKLSQFMFLVAIIVMIGFIIEDFIVVLSEKISAILRQKLIISKIIDKLFGSVLVGLGIKLILEEKN
jgi:threonine/homoserine/homoserine lactone efflux protein